LELFIAKESLPFISAIFIVLMVAIFEGIAMLTGISFSTWLDNVLPEGAGDSWLGWLHIGKVPILVMLVTFLTIFACNGLLINAMAMLLLGFYPIPLLSVLAAFIAAIPLVRMCASVIARIIPKDESYAIALHTLVGHVGVIVNGTAKQNYPAQAKVTSMQGQVFYVHVEPEDMNTELHSGESVLLVKHVSGSKFQAIANPRPDIL
jgi:hypothetical protein